VFRLFAADAHLDIDHFLPLLFSTEATSIPEQPPVATSSISIGVIPVVIFPAPDLHPLRSHDLNLIHQQTEIRRPILPWQSALKLL